VWDCRGDRPLAFSLPRPVAVTNLSGNGPAICWFRAIGRDTVVPRAARSWRQDSSNVEAIREGAEKRRQRRWLSGWTQPPSRFVTTNANEPSRDKGHSHVGGHDGNFEGETGPCWSFRRLAIPVSVDLDAQAKDDGAADQDDIFEICRPLVGRQKPLNAIEKFHDSTSRLSGKWMSPALPDSKTKLRRPESKSKG